MHREARDDSLFPAGDRPRAGGTRPWTDDQLLGITTVGQSLLVSAAAGSGKTAVLSERCVYLVCDAPQKCSVNELLVVTFTEAAALQMKERIAAALNARVKRAPSKELEQQLNLVEKANVSTLHSFCMRLLRQHFHVAKLDPAFRVLDPDEALLLRQETARLMLDDVYEEDGDGSFQRLVDAFGDGDDRRIVRQVLHAHELLTSVVDPGTWLTRSQQRIVEASDGPLEESQLGHELLEMIGGGLEGLRNRCKDAADQIRRLGFAKYTAFVADLGRTLDYWTEALQAGGIDALSEVVKDPQWPALPREGGDPADRELAKAAIDAVRNDMKDGAWRDVLRFTSREWQDGLKAMLPHAQKFIDLLDRFESRYRSAKAASRAIDFADLERYALAVLREDVPGPELVPSKAAQAMHRRFAHVLVDEYQDINEVQDAILRLVSRECIAERDRPAANLFCVGDVKQSIYRFRLAEPARFLEREAHFRSHGSHGRVIDLRHNFRSRKPLLDSINSVFERLMTAEAAEIDYEEAHRLVAGKVFPSGGDACTFTGSPIELHLLPANPPQGNEDGDASETDDLDRSEREALLVAQRIRQIMGLDGDQPTCVMHETNGGMEPQPAQFRDIVILLRAMKYKADQFAGILRSQGIPTHADSGSGYFESVEVRDVLALLELLDNQRQDIPLAAFLRSPIANLQSPEDSMARIRAAYPAGEEGVPFHEAVIRYAGEKDDDLAMQLRAIFARLADWREAARLRPVADVIWQVYQQSGYLAFVAGLKNGAQRVANLMYLHERAVQFGQFQRQGLSRFMGLLRELDEQTDLAPPSIASEAEDVVRIMSVHRSKGLEFPIVILPDLGKAMNMSDCHGHVLIDRKLGLGMSVVDEQKRCRYPSLALTVVKERLRRQTLAEELRVLYVAMTRAKEHLILVGTCREQACEKWSTRWTNHKGPLPADVVLGARSMLDWIGPVASATIDSFVTQMHAMEDVQRWQKKSDAAQPPDPRLEAIARLEPFPQDPPMPAAAKDAINRVTFNYEFAPCAQRPAAMSVTGMSQLSEDAPMPLLLPATLARPRFMPEGAVATAADRGTAMHLFLQHLRFSNPCDTGDLRRQVEDLVERRVLASSQASLIDLDAITWLAQTPLGQLLRRHSKLLRRELTVHFPTAPGDTACEPLDQIMVRGRVDLLVPLPDGAILVDYKTDDVPPQYVQSRADLYRSQLATYHKAIRRITGLPIGKTYVVFLKPRMVVEV